jgi:NAD dependent epimerase/dehydratase family enzyme
MAKDFTQHSGIPEVIEKFKVIFGQSQGSGKQVSSWITGDSNM